VTTPALDPDRLRLRSVRTNELAADDLAAIREIMDAAFGRDPEHGFDDDDWAHALGGLHVLAELDGGLVAHASVVARTLEVRGQPVRTGYVEAVATTPRLQGRGIGTSVMRVVNRHIEEAYELGALGTGSHAFYERLGWRTWQGPSSVRTPEGELRTADEDGYILVLETSTTPMRPLDLTAPISCDWRPGDVW
jgi:aminoglycoside 2'-N-acetyltransferase I